MAHKKKRHHSAMHHDGKGSYSPKHEGHSAKPKMHPSVDRNVVERGGQRGSMMQSDARHENAFGNMSFDPNAVAGFPRGVRMEEYPSVGVFLELDDNLGGSREGIERQMREDHSQMSKQIRPRKI